MRIFVAGRILNEFAHGMVSEIGRRYPVSADNAPKRKISVTRLSSVLDRVFVEAKAFRDSQGLGWIGKARLCNAFRWALRDAGYTSEFADVAVEGLVMTLSRRTTQSRIDAKER